MDLYHTTDVDGISMVNPGVETLREIIAQLDDPDYEIEEHPDVSLTHDSSGWSVSLYPSGIVTIEDLNDTEMPPRYLKNVSRAAALELWVALSRGNIEKLLQQPWDVQA